MALSAAQRREVASSRAAARAAARCSFQLTYARADVPRRIAPGGISGPWIDDAFNLGETSPGDWEDGDDTSTASVRDEAGWVDRYASYAINEAIHEALEWFQVDGRPWLNPHGEHENVIYGLAAELVGKLSALRNGKG